MEQIGKRKWVEIPVNAATTLRDNIVIQLGSEQGGQPKYMTDAKSKLMIEQGCFGGGNHPPKHPQSLVLIACLLQRFC